MTSPAVAIQLDPPARDYRPGEELSGRFRWDVDHPDDVRRVELSVLWYTEGKGDEDFGVHLFQRFAPEEDVVPRGTWHAFQTTLPGSPLSYEGTLVKIRWCVRVRVFLRNGKEVVGEKGFRLGDVGTGRSEERRPKGLSEKHTATKINDA